MTYEEYRRGILRKLHNLNKAGFEKLALDIFRFQAEFNPVFSSYLSLIGQKPEQVGTLHQIPFLPIQLFRNHEIKTGQWKEQFIFSSSGTTGQPTSRHFVRRLELYHNNCIKGFEAQYGSLKDYIILALLPSYLERSGSSLISMVEHFIGFTGQLESGFFLENMDELKSVIETLSTQRAKKVLLLGVSFALLDLAESFRKDIHPVMVMETGGMKGRRREITREELHNSLKNAFNVPAIHSEYGMTELFSQAWSKGEGLFRPGNTLKVLAREIADPFTLIAPGKSGVLNMIDLANLDTCSFIATDDLGKVYEDGTFEVLGRLDDSDIRGCNLMVQRTGFEN